MKSADPSHQQPPRVLVVEDEPQMAEIICFVLTKHGMKPVHRGTAETGWALFESSLFDVVLLDVMLPDLSGISLCRRIRAHSTVPILFLSALGSPDERIDGLEAGADDYLSKPFSPRELALRVRSLALRSGNPAQAESDNLRGVKIDSQRPVVWIKGQRFDLTAMSHDLLKVLASQPGEPFSARELLNIVWETSSPVGGREMVKTAVYRLRRELGRYGAEVIRTERGRGYTFSGIDSLA